MTFVDMLPNRRVIHVVDELLNCKDPFDAYGFLLEYEDLLHDEPESHAVTYRINEVIVNLAGIIEEDKEPVESDTIPKQTWRSLMSALPPEKLESLGDQRHIGDTIEYPVIEKKDFTHTPVGELTLDGEIVKFWEQIAEKLDDQPNILSGVRVSKAASIRFMSNDDRAALLNTLAEKTSPKGMVTFLMEKQIPALVMNITKVAYLRPRYWLEVAAIICERIEGAVWGPDMGVVTSILEGFNAGREDVSTILTWLDENNDRSTFVHDMFLSSVIQTLLDCYSHNYDLSDKKPAGALSDKELMTNLAKKTVRVMREGSKFPEKHWATLTFTYIAGAVPVDVLEEVLDLSLQNSGGWYTRGISFQPQPFVTDDYWISDDAVDREEKIRAILRRISQRGVGEGFFSSYSPRKTRAILDYYGWEESPKLVSFLQGLPAETTLGEAAELFKQA